MGAWGPAPAAIDLFAGAGGLSLGLEAAGFNIAAAVERDADACATFRANHPGAKVYEQDMSTMAFRALRGSFALVAGGPPCQPFSIGGKRLADEDPRNGIPQFVRAVDELRPRAFLMENVPGLVTAAKRSYFDAVVQRLEELGYATAWQVLQAASYGVAQRRQRLFLVGTHDGHFSFPVATHGLAAGAPERGAGTLIDPHRPVGQLNRAIVTYAARPTLRPSPYHGHLYNGGGRPIDLARPAPTMLATMGGNKTPWVDTLDVVPGYHAHLMAGGPPRQGLVPGARRVTLEEAAVLQSFPPGTVFIGRSSSRYRQVGNAVPPLLAEHIGAALLRQKVWEDAPGGTGAGPVRTSRPRPARPQPGPGPSEPLSP
jgi:DNA (cytosine-5)-methyltransferase 1